MSRHANSRVQEGTLEYINIVKKHEEIYNITHPGYKNLESKSIAWKRISEEINLPIGEFLKHFQRFFKIKWKSFLWNSSSGAFLSKGRIAHVWNISWWVQGQHVLNRNTLFVAFPITKIEQKRRTL